MTTFSIFFTLLIQNNGGPVDSWWWLSGTDHIKWKPLKYVTQIENKNDDKNKTLNLNR